MLFKNAINYIPLNTQNETKKNKSMSHTPAKSPYPRIAMDKSLLFESMFLMIP